FEFSGNALPAP
ncbi:hypothetical protein VCNEP21106_003517B, partial [Vibrio cholerae O1 str. Nep-21106]